MLQFHLTFPLFSNLDFLNCASMPIGDEATPLFPLTCPSFPPSNFDRAIDSVCKQLDAFARGNGSTRPVVSMLTTKPDLVFLSCSPPVAFPPDIRMDNLFVDFVLVVCATRSSSFSLSSSINVTAAGKIFFSLTALYAMSLYEARFVMLGRRILTGGRSSKSGSTRRSFGRCGAEALVTLSDATCSSFSTIFEMDVGREDGLDNGLEILLEWA